MSVYGYRYYDPETGRWLNRDPSVEDGGINLYAASRNRILSTIDFLGLDCKLQIDGENVWQRNSEAQTRVLAAFTKSKVQIPGDFKVTLLRDLHLLPPTNLAALSTKYDELWLFLVTANRRSWRGSTGKGIIHDTTQPPERAGHLGRPFLPQWVRLSIDQGKKEIIVNAGGNTWSALSRPGDRGAAGVGSIFYHTFSNNNRNASFEYTGLGGWALPEEEAEYSGGTVDGNHPNPNLKDGTYVTGPGVFTRNLDDPTTNDYARDIVDPKIQDDHRENGMFGPLPKVILKVKLVED